MYASIAHWRFNRATLAETRQLIRDKGLPILQNTPGLLAYYAIQESETAGSAVTIFEDEHARETFFQSPDTQALLQDLADLGAELSARHHGEVFIHFTTQQ